LRWEANYTILNLKRIEEMQIQLKLSMTENSYRPLKNWKEWGKRIIVVII
jgi:hypothetical protein